ncbi:MAG: hypothetical protein EA344_01340 [Alkalicoccus sp.]|nr:MAG: hypothetical protein EA344_01340 [Alkalicoccus sp.]
MFYEVLFTKQDDKTRKGSFPKALLKLRVVLECCLRLSFRPEESSRLPQASLPWHRFYGIKNSVHEK